MLPCVLSSEGVYNFSFSHKTFNWSNTEPVYKPELHPRVFSSACKDIKGENMTVHMQSDHQMA